MAKKDAIPTSRLSRSSKVGKLAATQAASEDHDNLKGTAEQEETRSSTLNTRSTSAGVKTCSSTRMAPSFLRSYMPQA